MIRKIKSLIIDLRSYVSKSLRNILIKRLRQRIRDDSGRTILCNMCLGGVIYHDLGLQFNSPFINLAIPANNFVSMMSNLDIINEDIIKVDGNEGYPVGLLAGKYKIGFVHYSSFEEGVDFWRRRSKRVNYEMPYLILVETITCSHDDLIRFDRLPYKNKIALVHKHYPDINCAHVLKGFDTKNENGEILKYSKLGTRMYDQVDWIRFLQLDNQT